MSKNDQTIDKADPQIMYSSFSSGERPSRASQRRLSAEVCVSEDAPSASDSGPQRGSGGARKSEGGIRNADVPVWTAKSTPTLTTPTAPAKATSKDKCASGKSSSRYSQFRMPTPSSASSLLSSKSMSSHRSPKTPSRLASASASALNSVPAPLAFYEEENDDGDVEDTCESGVQDESLLNDDSHLPLPGTPEQSSRTFGGLTQTQSLSSSASKISANPLDLGSFDSGFDAEFQRLMEVVNRDQTVLKEMETFQKLTALVHDFRHAALVYGKVIISEKHLPVEKKTIKPVEVGGYAGGEKYVAGNIFFRFPIDVHGFYGGSVEFASKEANHQMKGLTALFNASVPGLCLPLLCVIKHRGYKLVAMSVLPIRGQETLCYGSSDGGMNIGNRGGEDTRAAALMERAARALNLAKHPVRARARRGFRQEPVWLHMPCDMEVHRCKIQDVDRHYVVDFARLFPAQPPASMLEKLSTRGSPSRVKHHVATSNHLVHRLRPELVQASTTPLSSDAFSNFSSRVEPDDKFDRDALHAVERMFTHSINELVLQLESGLDLSKPIYQRASSRRVVELFHRHGVNMRFLGVVCARAQGKPTLQRELLLESAARVIKLLVRGAQRGVQCDVRTAVVTPYLSAVRELLNQVFGITTCTQSKSTHMVQSAEVPMCSCTTPDFLSSRPSFSESLHTFPSLLKTLTQDASERERVEEGRELMDRRNFWCKKLPLLLQDRFMFLLEGSGGIRAALESIDVAYFGTPDNTRRTRCSCCNCLWKRCINPAELFIRVQQMCGISITSSCQEAVMDALVAPLGTVGVPSSHYSSFRTVTSPSGASLPQFLSVPRRTTSEVSLSSLGTLHSSNSSGVYSTFASKSKGENNIDSVGGVPSPSVSYESNSMPSNDFHTHGLMSRTLEFTKSGRSCFDWLEPFEGSDLVDVEGSVHLLPIMQYAEGTELFIRARAKLGHGKRKEAYRLSNLAGQVFNAGLSVNPSDVRLLCNRGFLLNYFFEAFGEGERGMGNADFLHSLQSNRKHARSWYYVGKELYTYWLNDGHRVSSMCEDHLLALRAVLVIEEDKLVPMNVLFCHQNVSQGVVRDASSRVLVQYVDYCFRQALEADKGLINCVKDYANFRFHTLGDLAGAEALYLRALDEDPEHGRTLQNLAQLYRKRGEFDKAIETMLRNLDVDPENPLIHLDLANCILQAFVENRKESFPDNIQTFKHEAFLSAKVLKRMRPGLAMRYVGRPEEIASVLSRAFKYVHDACALFQSHMNHDLLRGHTRGRCFHADDPDVHAALSMRASKIFVRIGQMSYSCVLSLKDNTSRNSFLHDSWTCFEWAIRIIEVDAFYAEACTMQGDLQNGFSSNSSEEDGGSINQSLLADRDDASMFPTDAAKKLFYRLRSQLGLSHGAYGRCLVWSVDDSIPFRTSWRPGELSSVEHEKHGESLRVSSEITSEQVYTLERAFEHFHCAFRLDKRSQSLARMNLASFRYYLLG